MHSGKIKKYKKAGYRRLESSDLWYIFHNYSVNITFHQSRVK